MSVLIAKADGTSEPFNGDKLLASLKRAGAPRDASLQILAEVDKELYDGITTGEIYAHAFEHLRREHGGTAARYSLRRAVLEFGPTGFPFEAYVAELYRAEGYEAKIDQIVQGACVEHEVDVVLTRGSQKIYVEAKFHNTPGFKSDLKTVLYVKARIDDLKAAGEHEARGLVVTNTKFTDKALQYAQCQGLELLSWDYPEGKTLHDRIDKAGLYPVTALTSLNKSQKTALLNGRVVLCNALAKNPNALSVAGLSGKKAETVLEEVGALCVPGKDI